MTEIVLIAAVGKRGQLGLNGGLPWGNDFVEDRIRFRQETTGHIVVFGYKTWRSLVHLDGTHDRIFKGDSTTISPEEIIKAYRNSWPMRKIFIAGGARTYTRWLPYITRFDITVLPYDGEADVWMPTLFERHSATPDRKEWLQSSILAIDRAIANPDRVDPFVLGQAQAKREELQAELFALTGDDASKG